MVAPGDVNAKAPRGDRRGRFTPFFQSLLAGLVAALLLAAFVSIGGEVLEGDTSGFDGYILRQAQLWRAGHPRWVSAMRHLSGLGSTVVLMVFVLLSVGYLVLVSARTMVLPVAPGLSFPSGHATMSGAVFLTMGALMASTRSHWQERVYVLFAAAVLTALVGLSRIGLGVHWATDVLAGWAFGSAWAMAWLLVAHWSTHRDVAS